MSVGDPGFEPGTMASMDKFRLFYLPELIAPAGLPRLPVSKTNNSLPASRR